MTSKCSGLTKSGTKCNTARKKGSVYCGNHLNQTEVYSAASAPVKKKPKGPKSNMKENKFLACYFCSKLKDCTGVLLEDDTAAWCCEGCFGSPLRVMNGWPGFSDLTLFEGV